MYIYNGYKEHSLHGGSGPMLFAPVVSDYIFGSICGRRQLVENVTDIEIRTKLAKVYVHFIRIQGRLWLQLIYIQVCIINTRRANVQRGLLSILPSSTKGWTLPFLARKLFFAALRVVGPNNHACTLECNSMQDKTSSEVPLAQYLLSSYVAVTHPLIVDAVCLCLSA